MDAELLYAVVGIVSTIGGAGGAWGAAHVRIKHSEKQIETLEEQLALHDERTRGVGERLARMETLLNTIDARLERMGH